MDFDWKFIMKSAGRGIHDRLLQNGGTAMTEHEHNFSPQLLTQIGELDKKLKRRNKASHTILAVAGLMVLIVLAYVAGQRLNSLIFTRAATIIVVVLLVLLLARTVVSHRRDERFAASFYGAQLPSVLKKAYSAVQPRLGSLDPALFDPSETWCFSTTVTFLVLSMDEVSFRAQGIYRIQREYFKPDLNGDKDNDDSGQHCVSQQLLWKLRLPEMEPFHLSLRTASGGAHDAVHGMFGRVYDRLMKNGMQDVKTGRTSFDRDFCVRTDNVPQAERFLDTRWQALMELRDNLGQISLEYADNILTLSFSDFAPIDTENVRRTGLPNGLSAERIAKSAQELVFLSGWLDGFCGAERQKAST
ncbi:MAG TPA: hypothetical protein DCX90_04760 [Ruminococcaceae bacterium]|nr:hypothetical protein [Oscillospiraceae bacterium]